IANMEGVMKVNYTKEERPPEVLTLEAGHVYSHWGGSLFIAVTHGGITRLVSLLSGRIYINEEFEPEDWFGLSDVTDEVCIGNHPTEKPFDPELPWAEGGRHPNVSPVSPHCIVDEDEPIFPVAPVTTRECPSCGCGLRL
ncbi:unnamed protein product, partial [marine sediment metagenome]